MIRYKFLVLAAMVLAATSCAYDNPFQITSDTPTVSVFYGEYNLGDEEVTGPGFIYGPVHLTFKGDKPLTLVSLYIKFPASGKLASDVECSISGDDLEDAFENEAPDLILQPNVEYTSDARFVCTGLAAVNERATFIVTGMAKARGFTGEAGSQKFYKGETRVFLYWFPENDD